MAPEPLVDGNLGRSPSSSSLQPGTGAGSLDHLLTSQIGQFGRGQLLIMVAASLSYVPMVLVLMLMVFVSLDPVEARLWSCTNDTNSAAGRETAAAAAVAACQALLGAPAGAMVTRSFCAQVFPVRSSFQWTQQNQSVASEWDLVCEDAWKVPFVNSFCECHWPCCGQL